MSDFLSTYQLTRGRFDDAVKGLSQEQLNYRLHPETLTIGEMALHVAGVEFFVLSQLLDLNLTESQDRIRRCARDGALNENPFPFATHEISTDLLEGALQEARSLTEKTLADPTEELRAKPNESALGPMIDGTGAMVRLAYHPGYHHGQIWMIKSSPGFPA
ncbi:MAG: DinB family protein [Chthonomonas sp.]|nr:DinB family protein [Chthonomonas sp.]